MTARQIMIARHRDTETESQKDKDSSRRQRYSEKDSLIDRKQTVKTAWSCFGRIKEILQDKQLPISLKKQVVDQCILPTMTYGCKTWSLNKQTINKLRIAQRPKAKR